MPKFIIIYDDGMGLSVPYGWDASCKGAVQAAGSKEPVAAFPSRDAAKVAIRISRLWNQILKLRGELCNCDFEGEAAKHISIVPLSEVAQGEQS